MAAVARYVIIGAGAIGGGLGGRLHQAGRSALLVARGTTSRPCVHQGLRMRTPEEDLTLPVRVGAGPASCPCSPRTCWCWPPRPTRHRRAGRVGDAPVADGGTAGERLPIILATNGVAAEDMALRYFALLRGLRLDVGSP